MLPTYNDSSTPWQGKTTQPSKSKCSSRRSRKGPSTRRRSGLRGRRGSTSGSSVPTTSYSTRQLYDALCWLRRIRASSARTRLGMRTFPATQRSTATSRSSGPTTPFVGGSVKLTAFQHALEQALSQQFMRLLASASRRSATTASSPTRPSLRRRSPTQRGTFASTPAKTSGGRGTRRTRSSRASTSGTGRATRSAAG